MLNIRLFGMIKKRRFVFFSFICVAAMTMPLNAKAESKKAPKNIKKAEELIKLCGESHFPEGFQLSKKPKTVRAGDTFFHIYTGDGTTGNHNFRAIFFDNYNNYLGYYFVAHRAPSIDKVFLSVDDSAETISIIGINTIDERSIGLSYIPFLAAGLWDQVDAEGIILKFVWADEKKEKSLTGKKSAFDCEYRDWYAFKKKHRGRYLFSTNNAIFIEKESTGAVVTIFRTALSDADKTYLADYDKHEDPFSAFVSTENESASPENTEPECREWTIMYKGKQIKVQAYYEKQAAGNVFLKNKDNGVTKHVPMSALSSSDQEYVKSQRN